MKPKSRQEGMLNSPVLSLWLPWSYFSRLLRSCIGTVGLFSLPRPHRVQCTMHCNTLQCTVSFFLAKVSLLLLRNHLPMFPSRTYPCKYPRVVAFSLSLSLYLFIS